MDSKNLSKYVLLEKRVGETPLQCAEAWRVAPGVAANVPLAYAGRLDPMASGQLLVLIGDECKVQEKYHALDKTYEFSVLLGIGSDTHDVLGRLETRDWTAPKNIEAPLSEIAQSLEGDAELPYPQFSSKTVKGKPLHTWTLEGKLDEIEIPTKRSTIYSLALTRLETKSREEIATEARAKIDLLPEVTEASKAIGQDFRRKDVRADWERVLTDESLPNEYTIAHFTCHCSSGTYMRTLAKVIGGRLTPPTTSLAWHIHRTSIDL